LSRPGPECDICKSYTCYGDHTMNSIYDACPNCKKLSCYCPPPGASFKPEVFFFSFNDFQKEAAKTLPKDADLIRLLRIGTYNLWEAGEVGNIVKKLDEHGWKIDEPRTRLDGKTPREAIKDELGDLLWAASTIATAIGVDLAEVAKGNVEKLRRIHGESFNANALKERGR
jgi:NTP pyrophosphatase (non-canonical NTP hydrolase)